MRENLHSYLYLQCHSKFSNLFTMFTRLPKAALIKNAIFRTLIPIVVYNCPTSCFPTNSITIENLSSDFSVVNKKRVIKKVKHLHGLHVHFTSHVSALLLLSKSNPSVKGVITYTFFYKHTPFLAQPQMFLPVFFPRFSAFL